jgi:hypothetical protein
MISTIGLFKKSKASEKIKANGPAHSDQFLAMAQGTYWTVLNSSLLNACGNDKNLCNRANALKACLQTYGPTSPNLPDLRSNKGAAKSCVFHGHVTSSSGKAYVLEWTVIDHEKRIIALLNFDKHDNFSFTQYPITESAAKQILSTPENIRIIERVSQKTQEAKDKLERDTSNSRLIA